MPKSSCKECTVNGPIEIRAQNSTVSEEITTDISKVNKQSMEMTNSSSTVSQNASGLLELAKNLKKMVGSFKV
ncbi:MAG: hypothetical protein GY737_28870 [Desulfobacteraceae bacterium]|nr:hypothetical protein [Desulfobacteraceae bacterium]